MSLQGMHVEIILLSCFVRVFLFVFCFPPSKPLNPNNIPFRANTPSTLFTYIHTHIHNCLLFVIVFLFLGRLSPWFKISTQLLFCLLLLLLYIQTQLSVSSFRKRFVNSRQSVKSPIFFCTQTNNYDFQAHFWGRQRRQTTTYNNNENNNYLKLNFKRKKNQNTTVTTTTKRKNKSKMKRTELKAKRTKYEAKPN